MTPSKRLLRATLVALVAFVCAAAIPTSATAGSILGANSSGPCSSGTITYAQPSSPPAASYTAATGGVITSWSYLATASAPTSAKLRLLRPTNTTNTYITVGLSQPESPPFNQVSTYPTRLPIKAGDFLGFTATSATNFPCGTSLPGYKAVFSNSDPADGSITPYGVIGVDFQINISAVLEPDADGDGFGDETQDGCPTDASTQGACPDRAAPDTEIDLGPGKRAKRKRGKFLFSSPEVGTSFECAIDGSGFSACTSPLIKTFSRGRHVFQVRAVDAAGNADPTPATQSWKVVKKKHKKGSK